MPAALRGDTYRLLLLAPDASEPTGREAFEDVDAAIRAEIADGGKLLIPRSTAPGAYRAYLECLACASMSAGRTLLPVGELTVVALPDTSAIDDRSRSWLVLVLVLLAVAVLLGRLQEWSRVGRGT